MSQPSIVRRGTLADKPEVWRLFKMLANEQVVFPLCHPKIDWHFDRFLDPHSIGKDDGGPRGLIGVIGEVGKLEGMIILSLGNFWYTTEINLDELVNFVDPEHRSTNHSKALIGFAKNIVNELIPSYPEMRLIVGILSVRRTAAKIRLYGQQLQNVGGFFSWPPIEEVDGEPLKRLYRKPHEQVQTSTVSKTA